MANDNDDLVGEMGEDDRQRIGRFLSTIPDPNIYPSGVQWWPSNYLGVWLDEHRVRTERRATARLVTATWALAAMTLALVIATVVLVYVTAVHH